MAFGGIAEKLGSIVELVSGQSTITEANIEATLKEVKTILIDADVNLQVTNTLLSKVKEKAVGMKVEAGQKPGEQFISLIAKELVEVMGQEQVPLKKRTDSRPTTVLLLGLQGAGKTTAAGKLSNWALKQDFSKKLLLVAADVYRPAAIEQLKTLGAQLGVDVYSEGQDANPVQICRRAFEKAKAEGYDTVIFDTAGRQVVDAVLMDELRQIKAAITPDEVLLVVDAMTGQEAATLTATFNDQIGITGAVLTKMDGDTRGGAALSVRGVSGKPIKFVGVGEGMDDLEPFFPERMASRILGMGDVATLLEKAQSAVSSDEATRVAKKMQKGDFDFNDFIFQAQSVRKMGGMGGMLKMLPGMAGKITDEQLFEAEKRMKVSEAIVAAMDPEERSDPDIIVKMGGKKELVTEALRRRERLAEKTGLTPREIDNFIAEFQNMRRMMSKNLKGMDMDASNGDPNAPMVTQAARAAEAKKNRKIKPSRGGGGGFGG
ncbi:signal recognition particle protein [Ochromonadaceae sp. CCMP2298]|nr:signal recognition particle protein [Ochromonadaceae sp. CCMP2298]